MAINEIELRPDFKPARFKWSECAGAAIGAGAAEMDFGTAPAVRDAVCAAVDEGLHGYLAPGIAEEARTASARWQSESYGWAVDPAHVRLVPDTVTALRLVIEHFTAPGAPVVIPAPAYPRFARVARALGRRVVSIRLSRQASGRYRYPVERLAEALAPGGGLVVLCHPQNPTGSVADDDELRELSRIVSRYGGRVFADEIHGPLTFSPKVHVPYASLSAVSASHTITAVSASKAWNLSGMKCSEVVLTNRADRKRWDGLDLVQLAINPTSTLGAVAAAAAYTHGRTWLGVVRDRLWRNALTIDQFVKAELPGVEYRVPDAAFLAWLDVRGLGGISRDPARYFLEEAGVAMVDGKDFGPSGEGFVRLNFATSHSVLVQALERIKKAVGVRPIG